MLNPDVLGKIKSTHKLAEVNPIYQFIIHVPWKFSAWGGWGSVEPCGSTTKLGES
jgi:hypothetical protein